MVAGGFQAGDAAAFRLVALPLGLLAAFATLAGAILAMKWLLIGVFGVFGLHAVLWFPRGFRERRKAKHL